MNIKQIIKEEIDDFDFIRDTELTIQSVEDIKHFIGKPFNIILASGELNISTDDNIFWIGEKVGEFDYTVCWNEDGVKECTNYGQERLVNLFDPNYETFGVTWKFT